MSAKASLNDPGLFERKVELLQFLLREEGVDSAESWANATIRPRASNDDLPLSFSQQRLWFLDQWSQGSPRYNICMAFRMSGRFEHSAFEDALNEVVSRHESLRTTFPSRNGQPIQVITPSLRLRAELLDLRSLPGKNRRLEVKRLIHQEARHHFDLAVGPLLRASVVRIDREEQVLVLSMHHIISDGWSMRILVRELAALYEAFSTGRPSPLAAPSLQYADYAVWQRRFFQGEGLESVLEFWRGQLEGVPQVLELPSDRPRPTVQSDRGATRPFSVSGDVAGKLRDLGRRIGATTFMTVLAAFEAVLYRHSGQSRFLLGSPVANRDRPEIEPLIGFFVNTLLMRADFTNKPSFLELLRRVRKSALEAQEHQDLPFEKLLEELRPERLPSHSPLFQVMFALQSTSLDARETGLKFQELGVNSGTAKFDLLLAMQEVGGRMVGSLEYAVALFDASTVDRLLAHLRVFLGKVIANPWRPVGEIDILTPGERRQLVDEWNDTRVASPPPQPLHRWIEDQVDRGPECTALLFEDQEISYGELERRANQLANLLRNELGVGPEMPVGVCMERAPELVVALVAILKAGGAYLPLDPGYPAERLAHMLSSARPQVVLIQERLRGTLPGGTGRLFSVDGASQAIARQSADRPSVSLAPAHPAYVIYTSGSTGKPKGVMVPHSGIVNRLLWMQDAYALGPRDTVLQKTPFSFDVSVWEFFWPLMTGARLVIARPGGHGDAAYMAQLIQATGVTVMHFVPSMLHVFLEEPTVRGITSLRAVMASGEALPFDLKERFFKTLDCELHNLYGPTEASVDVTSWDCRSRGAEGVVPIGRPIWNTDIHLLDRSFQSVGVGVGGELMIGGAGLARCYLGRPALTAERFAPDRLSQCPGGRLYRTGDLARWRAGGAIEYLGRIDHQVKVHGFRIELGEIEANLNQHPAVGECVVVAAPGPGGSARLVGYYATLAHTSVAPEELRRFLSRTLPDYMIPAGLMQLDSLPLSPNGKVDRRALPAPELPGRDTEQDVLPASTPEEEILVAIWEQVLEQGPIGIRDNFFALGGDSILSVRVSALARDRGLSLTVQDLFLHQTIEELAKGIQVGEPRPASAAPGGPFSLISEEDRPKLPEGLEDAYPLTMMQAGMIYHQELHPADAFYHNVTSFCLKAPFEAEAFENALCRIVARHPAMRTSFDLTTYSEPLQLVHEKAFPAVPVEDLGHLLPEEQEEVVRLAIEGEKKRLFDFSHPPLMRFQVHRLGADQFQLTITESHTISDGWSLHSTLEELSRYYFGLLRGETLPEEPPAKTSYRDYVLLERQELESEASDRFWTQLLSECAATELPYWPSASPASSEASEERVVHMDVSLPETTVEGLEKLARALQIPFKSVLLAAHFKVLSVLSGQRDVVSGVITHGRPEEHDGERIRGLFLNTLPLRLDLGRKSWRELALAAFAAERESLPFRRYPLAALQRKWGAQPLFQAAFNYVHFHVVEGLMKSRQVEVRGFKKYEPTNFPLLVGFNRNPSTSQLALELGFDSRQVAPELRAEIASCYSRVLATMAENPDAGHAENCLVSRGQLEQLANWNSTPAVACGSRTIHELFEAQAERIPGEVALVDGESRTAYGELNARANQLAHHLRSLGVGPDVPVGICLDRSEELVVGLLAILKAGGAYVPMDPAYPEERLAFMLEDTGAPVLLTEERYRGRFARGEVCEVQVDAAAAELAAQSRENPRSGAGPQNLSYVIFTSGSTGRPKGVAIEHGKAAGFLAWAGETFSRDEMAGVLASTSVCFDLSVFEIFAPLADGGKIVLAENVLHLPTLPAAEEVVLVNTVPSAIAELVRSEGLPGSVRTVNLAGEALPGDLVKEIYARPGVARVGNLYGPSEDTTYSTAAFLPREADTEPTIGQPIAGTQAHLLDPDDQPVPIGVVGEIYLGGAGLARGYFGRPALTAQRFLPDPFARRGGQRLYRTGDRGRRRPDGEIDFLGRVDHQVKIRGFRIELGEVESLLRRHPAVRQAVVSTESNAAGALEMVAYIAAEAGAAPSAELLRQHLGEELPGHMVPAEFVVLEAIPLTPNGKVDRKALALSQGRRLKAERLYVAPRTEVERRVAEVWMEVLGQTEIGVDDNFFDSGGSSLLVLRIHKKLQQHFGPALSMADLFRFPTISSLARYLSRSESTTPAAPEVGLKRATTRKDAMQQRRNRRQHRQA